VPPRRLDFDNWPELTRLLDEALELPADARARWLDELALRSSALETKLRALLAQSARVETGDFLDTLPKIGAHADAAADSTSAVSAGLLVGPYKLVRELGTGGMGVVWLAQRADGLIDRPVALKFPRGNWIHGGLRDRMARERNLLAALEHPGIARLYDVGVTDAGDPYLALEYVEGEPLDQYCATRQLGVRERLTLFLQVIDAVASAHAQLIIHRDLKPANILASEPGRVRLLDFGIGQLLDADASVDPELAGQVMTPDYASPEQIAGSALTVASDIYSLGVVLYELLTGTRPYSLKRDSQGHLDAAPLTYQPPPPSEVATPGTRAAQLRGDLDAIVLKAIARKPSVRYASAHGLAEDIRRYLADQPVVARQAGARYRFGKFLKRHKLGTAAASLAVVAIVTGAGVALWQAKIAREQAARAEATTRFVTTIFEGIDPSVAGAARQRTTLEVLDRARDRVAAELADQPTVQTRLRAVLAQSYLGLYEPERARQLLAQTLPQAQTLAQAGKESDNDTLTTLYLLTAQALIPLGRLDEAGEQLDQLFRRLGRRRPDANYVAGKVARSTIAYERTQYDAAKVAAQEALAAAKNTAGLDDSLLANAHGAMGRAEGMLRNAEQSVAHNRDAYEYALRAFGGDHDHPRVLEAEQDYAASLIDVDRMDEAIPHLQRSLAAAEATYGRDSLIAARYSVRLGLTQMERGELTTAIDLIDRGNRGELAFHLPPSPATAGRIRTLARANMAARHMATAAEQIDASIAVMKGFDAPSMMSVLEADQAFAHAAAGGNYGTSLTELERIIQAQDRGEPRYKTHLPDIYLGMLQLWRGQPQLAQAALARGVALARKQTRHSDLGEALVYLGLAQLDTNDNVGARRSLEEGLQELRSVQTTTTPAQAEALVGLGRVALGVRDPATALAALREAQQFWAAFDPAARGAAEAAFWRGEALIAANEQGEARRAFRDAAALLASSQIPADRALSVRARARLAAKTP